MSLPYFNLYPADFEADTSHLTLEEDGAYNRLLRLMWMMPDCTLPDDAAWLRRRMRVDQETFDRVVSPLIDEFLQRRSGRIFSARLMREFKKADETSRKRSTAGKKGGRPKAVEKTQEDEKPGFDFDKGGLSDTRALPEPKPEPDIIGGGGSASTRETADPPHEVPTFRERILAAMNVGPDGVVGPSKFIGGQGDMAEAVRWLALPGLTEDAAVAEVERLSATKADGPAHSFRYFTPAMQRLSAALTAPALSPTAGPSARASPTSQPDLAASIARLEAQGRI